jgi:hypothetical protein
MAVHQAKAFHGEFCEPIFPDPKERLWPGPSSVHLQHRLICCDCGLAHDFEFQIVEITRRNGRTVMTKVAPKRFALQFRARRNEKSTAQVRRKPQKRR